DSYSTVYLFYLCRIYLDFFFFFQAEDGIRDVAVTGVQTCALPISVAPGHTSPFGSRRWFWYGAICSRAHWKKRSFCRSVACAIAASSCQWFTSRSATTSSTCG